MASEEPEWLGMAAWHAHPLNSTAVESTTLLMHDFNLRQREAYRHVLSLIPEGTVGNCLFNSCAHELNIPLIWWIWSLNSCEGRLLPCRSCRLLNISVLRWLFVLTAGRQMSPPSMGAPSCGCYTGGRERPWPNCRCQYTDRSRGAGVYCSKHSASRAAEQTGTYALLTPPLFTILDSRKYTQLFF